MSDTQSLQTSVRGYLPIKHQRIYRCHVFRIVKCLGWYVTAETKAWGILKLQIPHNLIQVIQHVSIARTSLDILGWQILVHIHMQEQLWHKHLHKHQKGWRYEGDLLIDAWSKHIDDIPCPVKRYWNSWLAILSIQYTYYAVFCTHNMRLLFNTLQVCVSHVRNILYQWIYAYYISTSYIRYEDGIQTICRCVFGGKWATV